MLNKSILNKSMLKSIVEPKVVIAIAKYVTMPSCCMSAAEFSRIKLPPIRNCIIKQQSSSERSKAEIQ